MARPLRLEFPGALYHVTSRGDRRENIYADDEDRRMFLTLLGEVCERFAWTVYAYCLMNNHYHLVLQTKQGNLSRGMRQLNGVFTQAFNRRHGRGGHVFQGRYKAILVDKDSYLLELSRYVVLNPVRARSVADPVRWPWSSYGATLGQAPARPWLATDWVLSQFSSRRATAINAYQRFVHEGIGEAGPWGAVRHQLVLGPEGFEKTLAKLNAGRSLQEVPKAQRRVLHKTLDAYQRRYRDRDAAMAHAYASGAYSMRQIAEFFGVHYMTVSRAVRKHELPGDS